MDVHDIDQDEECKYFLNTFENIEKQEFPLLLMEILDEPVETILKLINKIRMKINDISTDKVPTVRKFFLEYIPNILIKLRAVNNQSLNEYLYEYLVDTIFGQFFSEEVIFRQLARKIILHLLDRQLLTEAAVEQCVQNVLKSHANDDLPIFMFYIAPILGAEQTQKYFWKIFLDVIDGDPGSGVRKHCVRLIAILGSILGQEITEKDLLPIFVKLSKTSEWAIRKECALELPKISVLCSKQTREQVLTPVMEELLTDANKWVHSAAAEKLGILIATFAEPEILTLAINPEGDLYVVNVADDNENYKDMLSEEKLKNYQFYEDMFAETLIPTGADLGRTFGGVPQSSLFSASSFSLVNQDSMNGSSLGKTIICDSAWYNSMHGGAGPFAAATSSPHQEEASTSSSERLVPEGEQKGEGDAEDRHSNEENNPYQKFVHPNFLLNLSSFIMNTSSPSSASTSSTPPSPSNNPFHAMPLYNMQLANDRDYDFHNLYNNMNANKISNSNSNNNKNHNQPGNEERKNAPAASREEGKIGAKDSNGNDEMEVPSSTSTAETVKPEDVANNNNESSSVKAECPVILDNMRSEGVDAKDQSSINDNEEPMEGKQLELELAKLSLADDDDVNRTTAHLKRATPEGLPNVIKMAIKDKKKNKKGGGLKGLSLPPPPPTTSAGACADNNKTSSDNNNNDGDDNDADQSPPQTPSIEDAPTTCPFGGGGIEKDDKSVKTPETARILDMEEQKDLFAGAGDGSQRSEETVVRSVGEHEFFSNNYWYVKPPELTVDDLQWIEKGGACVDCKDVALPRPDSGELDSDLDRSLPPPPPPEDDDIQDDDLPEPMEKRRLFSLYSIKYKSYKLGEESGSGGCGGIMSSSMKASRDELLDNLFSNDSQQSSHLMMVKKSDINPQLCGQQVLPPILLHFFLEMSNFPEWDQICAYSFPAVVLTMGKPNWPLLKGQLQTLCCAIRWEVRQIIVASIYQIALIIGRAYASQDLVPIFLGFFKDLDNVKIEALHNVAKFLQVIDKRRHIEVVAHLGECLEPENVTNWRFRKDLAQEILKLMEIYKNDLEENVTEAATGLDDLALINEECLKYLTGYALRLLMDRVHSVREVAMEAIVSRMRFCNELQLWDLLAIIVSAFAQSSHWRRRQIFGQLCEILIQQEAIDMAEFEQKMLPALMEMAADKVPNVRLVVGKVLYKCAQSAHFTEGLRLKLEVILRKLETDSDRDVRASANIFSTDDSCVDESSVEMNRTNYLDETIECEPTAAERVPEVVVVGEEADGELDDQNETNTETEPATQDESSENRSLP